MLAIVPFQTQGDRESNGFADSLVEQLAMELARTRTLSVRLTRSALSPASRAPGERYCLVGTITHSANRMRVIVRLIDGEDERQLWGECCDGAIRDLLTLQYRVVDGVQCAVQPSIMSDQIERAGLKDPKTLGARDIVLRVLPAALSWDGRRVAQALELLRQAMELDSDYALPAALIGWHCARQATPWNTKATEEKALSRRRADRAGILAPADALVLTMRASIAHLAREFDKAQELQRASSQGSDMRVGMGPMRPASGSVQST